MSHSLTHEDLMKKTRRLLAAVRRGAPTFKLQEEVDKLMIFETKEEYDKAVDELEAFLLLHQWASDILMHELLRDPLPHQEGCPFCDAH